MSHGASTPGTTLREEIESRLETVQRLQNLMPETNPAYAVMHGQIGELTWMLHVLAERPAETDCACDFALLGGHEPTCPKSHLFKRRLADLPTGTDWQPIETAPRDGTLIIGALIRDGKIWRIHDMKHNGLAFYMVAGGSLPQMTHWMPLPAAPAKETT